MTGQPNPLAGLLAGGGGGDPNAGGGGMPPGMMGGDPSGGAGGMPPELAQMQMAGALAPQVLAQQQTEYYKKFLKTIAALLREFMRTQGIGPRTVSTVGRSVTGLEGAINSLDKERPDAAGPVESLLASSLLQRPQMGAAAGQQGQGLPIQM